MRDHDGTIPLGVLQTVVPAAPDAGITALHDYGKTRCPSGGRGDGTHDGFAAHDYMCDEIAAQIHHTPTACQRADRPAGRAPPKVGARFVTGHPRVDNLALLG